MNEGRWKDKAGAGKESGEPQTKKELRMDAVHGSEVAPNGVQGNHVDEANVGGEAGQRPAGGAHGAAQRYERTGVEMWMEPQPFPPPAGSESSRRRFPLLTVSLLAVLLGLVGAGVLYLVPATIESSQLLTTDQFQRAVRPGRMTQLKWKLMRLAGPLWPKARTFVHTDFKLYATTNDAWPQPLGIPLATNSGGLQLWRVNHEDLQVLKGKLAAAVGVQKLEGCWITTSDGGQAEVNVGATTNVAGKLIPLGSAFNVLPKMRDGKFQVFVETAVTEMSSKGSSMVQTNFRAACASAVSDGGGLVLAGPHQFTRATQYWCVFSILQVDGKGNPARLGKAAVKD